MDDKRAVVAEAGPWAAAVAQRSAGHYIPAMRAKRLDVEGMELDLLMVRGRPSSSTALAVYNVAHHRLRLKFRPSGTYDYFGVPMRIIAAAIAADSMGRL